MASPVSSRAAAAPMQRRNQRERRARSLPTRNATNAESITKYKGFLPWITACATEPFCTRQMIHTAIAAAAAVSAAAPAFTRVPPHPPHQDEEDQAREQEAADADGHRGQRGQPAGDMLQRARDVVGELSTAEREGPD